MIGNKIIRFKGYLLVVVCLLLSINAWSQNKGDYNAKLDSLIISSKDTASFETYYYEALKEKVKGDYGKAVNLLRKSLRFQPDNADVQFELSINYKTLKDYRQAILFGENAVRFNPNQKWYWVNVADLYSLVGDNENAARCYAKLSELDPDFIPEYVKSLARSGHVELALQKVDSFLETNNSEELLLLKRDLLVANNRNEEAIELTAKLIELQPNKTDYYLDISDLLLESDKVKKAQEYVEKGLSIAPEDFPLLRQEFKILLRTKKIDEAFEILDKTLDNPNLDFNKKMGFVITFVSVDVDNKETPRLIKSLESWVEKSNEARIYPVIGNLYKAEGEKENALKTFRKGFNAGYTDFSGLIDMLILEQELSEYKLLVEDTDKMLEIYPNQPILLLFKGLGLSQLGEYDESIAVLQDGVKYVVSDDKLKAEFHSLIASSYYSKKELDKCFAEYDKAISYDAENIMALNNYSYYLSESDMHLDKALEMIKQVIEAEPNNPTYLDTMGWVYYKLGDYKKAESVLKLALKNGGDSSSGVIEHYGDALFRLGKERKAVRQWKKAYKLNKSSITLKEKISKRAIQ